MHCFHEFKDRSTLVLTSDSQYFAILNVESKEFIFHNISLDVNFVEFMCKSNVLYSFVIVAGPKERNVAKGNHFAEHIKSRVRALIHRSHVMFNSHSSSSHPIRIRCDVTGSEYIFG